MGTKKVNTDSRLALVLIICTIVLFCSPLLIEIGNLSQDESWLQSFSYDAFLRKSILKMRQLPLWSPYFSGGYPFIEHPKNTLLSPLFLLSLSFGEIIGLKLMVLSAYILGAWGMFYLTRRVFKFNLLGATFSALIFTMNSYFPFQVSTGNIGDLNSCYFPWLLACFIQSRDNKSYLIPSSLLLVFLIANGAELGVITMLLFLFLFSTLKAIKIANKKPKLDFSYFRVLSIIVILTLFLGAARVLPIAELLYKNDRSYDNYSEAAYGSLTVENFYHSLLSPGPYIGQADRFNNGQSADSTMYFGYLPIGLCLLGFFLFWRQLRAWFLLLLIFIILCLGKNSFIDLFKLLWQLPLFHSLHYPNRHFAFYCMFIIAIVAAKPISHFESISTNRLISFSLLALTMFSCIHLFNLNRVYHLDLFNQNPVSAKPESIFYHQAVIEGSKSRFPNRFWFGEDENAIEQYKGVYRNTGLLSAYMNIALPTNVEPKYFLDLNSKQRINNQEYRGEAFFLNGNSRANLAYFSHNKIIVDVKLEQPDILVVNQNYDRNWCSNRGRFVLYRNLLALSLAEKGNYKVELSFVPRSFYLGLAISLISFVAIGARALSRRLLPRGKQ